MKKPDFSRIAKSVKVGLHKHSPEILTGIGIAGMITTTVLAVRATPRRSVARIKSCMKMPKGKD